MNSSCTKGAHDHRLKLFENEAFDGRGSSVYADHLKKFHIGEVDVHLGYMDVKIDKTHLQMPIAGISGIKKRLNCPRIT